MRSPSVASENKLAITIFVIAIAFLMLLAGGPSEFMIAVERTLESLAAGLYHIYQNARG